MQYIQLPTSFKVSLHPLACTGTTLCDKTGSIDSKCLTSASDKCACKEGYFGDKCDKERGS